MKMITLFSWCLLLVMMVMMALCMNKPRARIPVRLGNDDLKNIKSADDNFGRVGWLEMKVQHNDIGWVGLNWVGLDWFGFGQVGLCWNTWQEECTAHWSRH